MRIQIASKSKILIVVILLSVMVVGCGDDKKSPTEPLSTTFITLQGRVIHVGMGFKDVSVTLMDSKGTKQVKHTDEEGSYLFEDIIAGGIYALIFQHDNPDYILYPTSISFNPGYQDTTFDDIIIMDADAVAQDITFVSVPSGEFQMGSYYEYLDENPYQCQGKYSDELPVHTVTVDDFEMSKTEITELQYCKFLNAAYAQGFVSITVDYCEDTGKTGIEVFATGGKYAGNRLIGYSNQIYSDHGYYYDSPHNTIDFTDGIATGPASVPIKRITWYGAMMFAEFYGYDLPTEAEWEYASRGGKNYQYGTDDGTINPHKAYYMTAWDGPDTSPRLTVPSYLPNPFSLHNLTGNLKEWCKDIYNASYYAVSPEYNPAGPVSGVNNVVRGGSYASRYTECRSAYRLQYDPSANSIDIGFRVVKR